jgi:hypothetical protein
MKDPLTAFAPEELHRYARHLSLGEVGPQGQLRLKEARVLVVGAGGLGSPAALYLAAAGVGTLGIVDGDRVELSNLQRQVLHTTAAVGRPKVASARERLEATNPHVRVVTHPFRLTAANAMEIVAEYDLVVDGSDNFPPATWSMTPVSCRGSPGSTAPSSAGRGRCPSSGRRVAPATGASFASLPRRDWFPAARRPGSSEPSPARWAPCRPWRR